jgi:5'-3' exonuclease
MGISDLNSYIRKNYPSIYEEIPISSLAYKKIAIDISLYLCLYKSSYGEDWLKAFIKLISCLRKNEVHCVFIYDSGSPPEKSEERKKRRENRNKMEEKVWKLEEALDDYYKTGVVDKLLIDFVNSSGKNQKRLINPDKPVKFNDKTAKYYIEQKKKQLFELRPEDYKNTKDLFDILQVPYYDAPLEAEKLCSDLCKRGLVDAVLTEDSDVMAYGCPVYLSKIDVKKEKCVRISFQDVLTNFEMIEEEFLDMCIMFGTDYNKRIRNFGPCKIVPHVQKFKNIENIIKEIETNKRYDIKDLNYIRVRELFNQFEIFKIDNIPFCGFPDIKKLSIFLKKNNINMCVEQIESYFVNNNFTIEEE